MGILATFWSGAMTSLPVRVLSTVPSLSLALVLPLPLFRVLAVIKIRNGGLICCRIWKPYPDGEPWTGPSDPPEFRRFLDLRTKYQMLGEPNGVCAAQRTSFGWYFFGFRIQTLRVQVVGCQGGVRLGSITT